MKLRSIAPWFAGMLACAFAVSVATQALAAPKQARGQKQPAGQQKGGKKSSSSGKAPALRSNDGRAADADAKVTTATFGPKRVKPVFTGEFKVDLIVIAFPDCTKPDPAEVKSSLEKTGSHTIKEYFEEYSQGVTWPELQVCPYVYDAPMPYGYYCRFNEFSNKVGFSGGGEGSARAEKLRADALAFARKNAKGLKPAPVVCYVYCNAVDMSAIDPLLRPYYPKPTQEGAEDRIKLYKPPLPWADPLWPNSIVQVTYPADGGTLVHELGHVMGAPDFYHASEEHDGINGCPSLPWAYGPTGPAYCRYIYQAFVPKETYPTYTQPGTYTLDARNSMINQTDTESPKPILGCFVPSSHPNYMFVLEYAHDEKPPVGKPGTEGLLVSVINVTMSSPMLGPPDLCYTYRKGDTFLKGEEPGEVCLRAGDEFTMKSDPAARIPPLIPAGVEITDIKEEDGKCTFTLSFPKTDQTPKFLKDSLLPKIRITEVDELQPNSMRAHCEMMYRGEPLVDEYGFTWDTTKNPTVAKNRYPLYHRDRWDARILGLKPATKYYVRAYAKNANGITYSKREIEVTTPDKTDEVPVLLTDHILDNFYITRWYFTTDDEGWFNSGNTIITLMSLGVYYGTMPGGAAKGAKPLEVRRVHTNPSESRPKFRMAEFEEYFNAMKQLAKESGLRERKFGKMQDWQKRCAKALKVKDPAKAFVHVPDASSLTANAAKIRASLSQSRPVLLIRQNELMPDVTDRRYPLDIAVIDGIGSGGEWHVTFPLGHDRGVNSVLSGYVSVDTLMTSVEDACLFFYAPEEQRKGK